MLVVELRSYFAWEMCTLASRWREAVGIELTVAAMRSAWHEGRPQVTEKRVPMRAWHSGNNSGSCGGAGPAMAAGSGLESGVGNVGKRND